MNTITPEYRAQQKKLHENPGYGVASLAFAPLVAQIYKVTQSSSINDYGAGKMRLLEGLDKEGLRGFPYFPYDPAFEVYGDPKEADLAVCIDVLEHVESECISNVLQDLAGITKKFGFFTVHTGPAGKVLDDGRNAHLTQKPASWWLPRIVDYFEPVELQHHKIMGGLLGVCGA